MAERNSARPSPFEKRHIEESAKADTTTLMEHLNLPPAVIEFVEKNKKMLWICVGVIISVVVIWSLYDSYATSRQNKAATALTKAFLADPDKKSQALSAVAADFSGTPSALWSKIELAQLLVDQGDFAGAITEFTAVKEKISKKNALMPLLVAGLASAHEKNNDFNGALEQYKELAGFEGFAPTAYLEMARLYEMQEKKEEAIQNYELYLSENIKEGQNIQAPNPTIEYVRSRLTRLRE